MTIRLQVAAAAGAVKSVPPPAVQLAGGGEPTDRGAESSDSQGKYWRLVAVHTSLRGLSSQKRGKGAFPSLT